MYSTPRRAPSSAGSHSNVSLSTRSTVEKSSAKGAPQNHSRRGAKEVAKPITIAMRRSDESDDTGSSYSVNGATVYDDNPSRDDDIPPPVPSKYSFYQRQGQQIYFVPPPSPPPRKHGRRPSLRDMIKPVNQLDLPPEIQKDLLPPNPILSDKRYLAAKAREEEERQLRAERERAFRQREAQLPFPQHPVKPHANRHAVPYRDPVVQSSPARYEQPKVRRAEHGSSAPRQVHNYAPASRVAGHHRDGMPYHAPRAPKATPTGPPRNLKVDTSAHHDDRSRGHRGAHKHGLPASPRPEDARKVQVAHVPAGHPTVRLDNRKVQKGYYDPRVPTDSYQARLPSYHYTHGHFRMHPEAADYYRHPPYVQTRPCGA